MRKIQFLFLSEEPQVAEDVNTQQQEPLQSFESQESTLLQLIESSPGILESDPEIKGWYDAYITRTSTEEKKIAPKKTVTKKTEASKESNEEGNEEGNEESNEEGNEEGSEESNEEGKKSIKKSPFFGKKGKGAEDFGDVTVENLQDTVKSKFGIDTTKEDWLPTFLASTAKHRANAAKATANENKVLEFKNFLDKLPVELRRAIDAVASNADWKSAISSAEPLSFDSDFSKLTPEDKSKAIKFFLKKDVAPADLSKDENKELLNLAEEAYGIKVQKIELQRKENQTKEADRISDFRNRVSSSAEALKKDIPEFDDESISEIVELITSPERGIGSLFVDKNGKLLPDAVKRVAYAFYGDDLLSDIRGGAESKGANEERKRVLETSISDEKGGKGKNKKLTNEEEKVLTESRSIVDSYKSPYD